MRTTILFLILSAGLTFSKTSSAQSMDSCNVTASFTHINSCETYFQVANHNPSNNYFWDFGDGGTSNLHLPLHQYGASGTYNVTLIVSNDTCADTLTQAITVDLCPPPCGINPSFIYFDSLCYVSFIPSTNGATTYFWDFGDGNSSNDNSPYYEYSASGNYNVTLTVSNDTCVDTIMQVITVPPCDPPCNLNAGFTYSDTSNCGTDFIPSNYNPYHSYSWDLGDGSTSNSDYPYHVYNTPGTYNVTLTVSNDTCVDTIMQVISVPPCNPPCNLNAGFTYSDTSNCGTAFIPSNYNPYHSYSWDFGDGSTSTSDYPYHVYNTSGTYNVTLTVSNDTCLDTIMQVISVPPCDPPCNLGASFIHYDSLCYSGFIPAPQDSSLSYLWFFGDGNTSTDMEPVYQYGAPGTYNVTLVVSDSSCSDTLCKIITILPCPPACPLDASFSYVNTSGNTFNFSPTAYDASYTYHWIFGDGTTSTNPNATHTFANEEDYFVTLVVSDCNCSASETSVLSVADSSNCDYNGDFTYTEENDGSYTFTPVYQSSNYEYYWSFGDGSSAYNMAPNYSYLLNGNYTVSLTIWEPGNSECSDTTDQNIHVSDSSGCQLNSSFTISSDTSNTTIHFYPNVYNSNYDYFWDFGDGQTSSFHSPNHSYASNGMYLVTLTVYFDSCQSSDTTLIPMLTANLNSSTERDSEVNIYPNPASDYISIDFNSLNSERIEISLIDANGKLVKQDAFTALEGENHKQINLQSISQGMYQLILREENGTFIQRSRFVKN